MNSNALSPELAAEFAESLKDLTVLSSGLAELTEKNAAIVDNALTNDPNYKWRVFGPRKEFIRLKRKAPLYDPSEARKTKCDNIYNDFTHREMYMILSSIKSYNKLVGSPPSGHLRDIASYILYRPFRCFARILKGDLSLVEDINKFFKIRFNRAEPIMSSKICAYLSIYLFGLDNYCVYDKVTSKLLPEYRKAYNLKPMPSSFYTEYCAALEDLRRSVCPKLTKTQLHHIIWYINK